MSGTRTAGKAASTKRPGRAHPKGSAEAKAATATARAARAKKRDSPEARERRSAAAKKAAETRKRNRQMIERWRPAAPEDYETVERELEKAAGFREQQKRMTAAQRVARDEAVVAGLAMGLTVGVVAKKAGLTRGQVEQIRDAARERYIGSVPRGESVLWDALRALDSAIEQAAVYCQPTQGQTAAEASDAVRVAWFKFRRECQTERLELMLAMGLVSATPATYERERQARDYMLRFLDGLRDAGVDPDVIERVASSSMPVDVPGETRRAAAELRAA